MDHMVQRLHVCSFTCPRISAIRDATCLLLCRHAAVGHMWHATTCQCATDTGSMQPDTAVSDLGRIPITRSEKHGRAVSHPKRCCSILTA